MKKKSQAAKQKGHGYAGVEPYPGGVNTAEEQIDAGQQREEVSHTGTLTKAQAIAKAVDLHRQMPGTGWSLQVWQNLGWHYSVRRGPLRIHPHVVAGRVYYSAYLSGDPQARHGGGEMFWHDTRSHTNPNDAVRGQLETALAFIEGCNRVVAAANGQKPRR